MWTKLYRSLDIQGLAGEPVDKPTSNVLKDFERDFEFVLPTSYKDYIKVFGAGELGGYFNIYAPGYPERVSLEGCIAMFRKPGIRTAQIEKYGDRDFIDRMVPFGGTIGGDTFAWDPEDVRDKRNHEHGIYVLPDDAYRILEIADSFRTFVEDVCLGDGFKKVAGDGFPVDRQFVPFGTMRPRPT